MRGKDLSDYAKSEIVGEAGSSGKSCLRTRHRGRVLSLSKSTQKICMEIPKATIDDRGDDEGLNSVADRVKLRGHGVFLSVEIIIIDGKRVVWVRGTEIVENYIFCYFFIAIHCLSSSIQKPFRESISVHCLLQDGVYHA